MTFRQARVLIFSDQNWSRAMKRLMLLLAFCWPVAGVGLPLDQVQEWCDSNSATSLQSRGWCESYLIGFADSLDPYQKPFESSWERNLRSKACESTDPKLKTACSYYWLGFFEGDTFMEESGWSQKVCIEDDVSATSLRNIFIKFAKTNESGHSQPAADTILSAIANAFPCK